jgi:hypothetical protein
MPADCLTGVYEGLLVGMTILVPGGDRVFFAANSTHPGENNRC